MRMKDWDRVGRMVCICGEKSNQIFCSKNQTSFKVSCVSHTSDMHDPGLWPPLLHSSKWNGDKRIMNCKGFGRKRSWPKLKVLPSWHLPWGTEKNHENFSQDSLSPGTPGTPPEYKAGKWTITFITYTSKYKLILQHYHKYLYIKELEFQIWRCKPKAVQIYAATCLLWLPD
jgi:hypothetical protein